MAACEFSPTALEEALSDADQAVRFILLHGSARDGIVQSGGDIDVAVYAREPLGIDSILDISARVEGLVPGVKCDLGLLRGAEPVYCFEALKGRLVLCRDLELYLDFFSEKSRLYESQMASYERQRRYRLEGRNAA